jgi:lipopolysaccharide export system protein LptA
MMLGMVILCAGNTSGQPGRVVVIENADSLIGTIIDGEQAKILAGNVRMRQEETRLSCDRAVQFTESGKVVLTGNLVVEEDSLTLRAPRGIFHRDTRRTEAFGGVALDDGSVHLTAEYGEYLLDARRAFFRRNVVVRDTSSRLNADSLIYERDERRSVAMGRVLLYLTGDNVTITGRRMVNYADSQFTVVTGEPGLVQVDTSSEGRIDTLVVRSRIMESYREPVRRLVAIDTVRIVRAELAARAGRANFFTDADSILLRQSPVIWYGETQVAGDSIDVFLFNRSLREVDVLGDAFALSRSDSLHADRYDQLSGNRMRLYFENKALQHIEVDVQASSLYHLYEAAEANGLNKTSGDRIVMTFVRGKIDAIRIFGGVEGQYFPENLVGGHEAEFALPGFLVRPDRPWLSTEWAVPGTELTRVPAR